MRHGSGLRKLNRTSAHRLAMLRNMTVSLLRHEEIRTTLPKAKELRRVAEPMITLGKKPSLANRRLAFDRLRDRGIVAMLFNSAVFLFAFLPATLAAYYVLGRYAGFRAACGALIAASLFFYGWWSPKFLVLLVAATLANAALGFALAQAG